MLGSIQVRLTRPASRASLLLTRCPTRPDLAQHDDSTTINRCARVIERLSCAPSEPMDAADPSETRQTRFWAVRDYLAPVLRDSKFKETGRITPDEFVAAGDFLVYKFPTWQWEAGEPSKRRDFLPADKQYLVSRNGQSSPCL